MTDKPRVLLVEDTKSLATLYKEYVRKLDCHLTHAADGMSALEYLRNSTPDVLLLDLGLPDMSGLDILKIIHEDSIEITVIVITAHGSVDIAVDAMRYGAFDFLVKPFDAKRLSVTLNNALERIRLSRIVETYKTEFERKKFAGFIGSSLPMQAVYRIIESAAPSRATIFITGESGTGKEVCARAIHSTSPRHDKPFIALNCAAIPKELMESQIFGHTKGAFTGATSAHQGAAASADGGTLFLDEICEMDLELQAKLLRFIQTGSYQKLGSTREEKVDIRFVCATNRDPWIEVQEGRFREDLFYRLHVIPIELPPLRNRGDDIMDIAEALLFQYSKEEGKDFKGFSDDVRKEFLHYHWPGNVRQMQNLLRNVIVLQHGEIITSDFLPELLKKQPVTKEFPATEEHSPPPLRQIHDNTRDTHDVEIRPLWKEEKLIIERAISACNGNIPKAASLLDVSPSTIYRKRQTWQQKPS